MLIIRWIKLPDKTVKIFYLACFKSGFEYTCAALQPDVPTSENLRTWFTNFPVQNCKLFTVIIQHLELRQAFSEQTLILTLW